jgi:tetratricopeptide (TPR) repeat protein
MSRVLAILLALAVATGAVAAEPRLTRPQALERLADGDAARRREAIERLADVGKMEDAQALVKELRDKDPQARKLAEATLWKIWSRSGDKKVDALYARGLEQMARGQSGEALATFTRIITMKPAFAEAWNKRATLLYLLGDLEDSLADCDEVLKRNPFHFGALAGYFQIYVALEDYERALGYAQRALAINPNLEGVREGVEAVEERLGRPRQSI